jgi:hypothetical protein
MYNRMHIALVGSLGSEQVEAFRYHLQDLQIPLKYTLLDTTLSAAM